MCSKGSSGFQGLVFVWVYWLLYVLISGHVGVYGDTLGSGFGLKAWALGFRALSLGSFPLR